MNESAQMPQGVKVVRVVGIGSLIAAVPLLLVGVQLNQAYVAYHDDRYTKRGEAITIADAAIIKHDLSMASAAQQETSVKLDRLIISQARAAMWAADDRLRGLIARGVNGPDLREAEKNLEQARDVYNCLRDSGGPRCDLLNGS